jgi:hypothetical protein
MPAFLTGIITAIKGASLTAKIIAGVIAISVIGGGVTTVVLVTNNGSDKPEIVQEEPRSNENETSTDETAGQKQTASTSNILVCTRKADFTDGSDWQHEITTFTYYFTDNNTIEKMGYDYQSSASSDKGVGGTTRRWLYKDFEIYNDAGTGWQVGVFTAKREGSNFSISGTTNEIVSGSIYLPSYTISRIFVSEGREKIIDRHNNDDLGKDSSGLTNFDINCK